MRKTLMILTMALMLSPLVVGAQTSNVTVTYRTTRPTTGSPIVKFLWELKTDAGAYTPYVTTTDSLATFSLPYNHIYLVRVKGEDADGDQGDYSVASDPFNPNKPGACGKPVRLP